MTTFTITTGPRRGDYLLRDEAGRSRGSLEAGWTLRRARIETSDGSWAVQRRGWQQVEVDADHGPTVSFGPDQISVPGPGPQPTWSTSRERGSWHGSLRRGSAVIDVRLTAPGAREGQVSVTGEWEQLDLIILIACFALVLRHRRRVVVGAGGA